MAWWPINPTVKLILGILGNLSALGLFLAPMVTILVIWKHRSCRDFSELPYVTTLLNCLLWTSYGLPFIGEGRILVITINAVGVALEAFYILPFLIFSKQEQSIRTTWRTTLVLLFYAAIMAVTLAAFHTYDSRSMFLGLFADVITVCMYAAPLGIMRLVIRTKSVEFMPFYLSLNSFLNGVAWTAYATYVGDLYIMIPNSLGAILGAGQLVLYAIYSRNPSAPATSHKEAEQQSKATESQRHMLSSMRRDGDEGSVPVGNEAVVPLAGSDDEKVAMEV